MKTIPLPIRFLIAVALVALVLSALAQNFPTIGSPGAGGGGGGGVGLPGTNQNMAFGDARNTNSIGQYGNQTIISNAQNQIVLSPGPGPGSLLSLGSANGLSNVITTASGSNDLNFRAGPQTTDAKITNGNLYVTDATFLQSTLGVSGALTLSNSFQSPSNSLPLGNATVIVDATKPKVFFSTNASFAFGGIANLPGQGIEVEGWIAISNALGSTINATFTGGWALDKAVGTTNLSTTWYMTNGPGAYTAHWLVMQGVHSNFNFFTKQ